MVVGEYVIESKIGEGAMGTVYGANHPLIGKKVAVKVIAPHLCSNPMVVDRFLQEARIIAQLGHPNIIDIFTFGQLADGRSYFVMEWLDGESLDRRMKRGPLSLVDTVTILFQLADALEAAHECGVVHRDLKSENVYLVTRRRGTKLRWTVKLLDFGIAKLTGGQASTGVTSGNVIMGTPDYMSPEQARSNNVDGRADIYSLGVVAYEMILGRLPFIAQASVDVLRLHLSEPPPRPSSLWPEIPAPLERMLLHLLKKNPVDRPTLGEFRAYLAQIRDGTSVEVAPPVSTESEAALLDELPARSFSRRTVGLILASTAGLGLLALIGSRLHHTGPVPAAAPSSPLPVPRSAAPRPVVPPAPSTVVPPTGTLVVHVIGPDARIKIDGREVAKAAQQLRLAIETPGPHLLEVAAAGRRAFRKHFSLERGATVEISAELEMRLPTLPKRGKNYMLDPFDQ